MKTNNFFYTSQSNNTPFSVPGAKVPITLAALPCTLNSNRHLCLGSCAQVHGHSLYGNGIKKT